MERVSVDRLKPGMTVGKTVTMDGVTIIGAGIILSGRQIAALKERGIAAVEVDIAGAIEAAEGASSDTNPADQDQVIATREEIEGKVDALFADVVDDPVMEMIARQAKACLVSRIENA